MKVSILDDIKSKAERLIGIAEPHVTRQTQSYDASKNKVYVAGCLMDGLVNTVISSDTITKQEVGIDYYYTTYYHSVEPRTLTLQILPTAKCLNILRDLALKQQKVKGWFNISIFENGNIINVYRAWIISLPEIDMQKEAGDRQVVFGIKTHYAGTTSINQVTETENDIYHKYGTSPDLANPNASSVINEDSGVVTTPIWDASPESLGDVVVSDLPQEDFEGIPSIPDDGLDNGGGFIEGEGFPQ